MHRAFMTCCRVVWVSLGLAALPLWADAIQVPRSIGYQAYLTNGGGEALASGPTTLEFRITDAAQQPLFTETQSVEVVGGVVSAVLGFGANAVTQSSNAGIPIEVLASSEPRFLEVYQNGILIDDPTQIVSVPYARIAERVAHAAVDSTALAPQSVQIEHLSEAVLDKLAEELPQRTEFQSALTISGTVPFAYSQAASIEDILHDLDRAIKAREEKNVNRAGDTMGGALAFISDGGPTATIDAKSGNITLTGTVDGVDVGDHVAAEIAHGAKGRIVGVSEPIGGDLQGTVAAPVLRSGVVTGDKIADGAITATDVAVGGLSGDRLAPGTVTSAQLADGSITATDVAVAGLSGDRLAPGTITGTQIADGSVQPGDLSNNTYATINNNVTNNVALGGDLGGDPGNAQIQPNTVGGVEVIDKSLGGNDIADGSLTGAAIADQSLTGADLADGSIGGEKLSESAKNDLTAQAVAAVEANSSAKPPVPTIVAWASDACGRRKNGATSCDQTNSYNISADQSGPIANGSHNFNFQTPMQSDQYAVIASVSAEQFNGGNPGGGRWSVSGQTKTGFSISLAEFSSVIYLTFSVIENRTPTP